MSVLSEPYGSHKNRFSETAKIFAVIYLQKQLAVIASTLFRTVIPKNTLQPKVTQQNGNLRQALEQLGHASPATTANMYADISF